MLNPGTLQGLVNGALKEIEELYGTEGQTPLAYHNQGHTAQVVEAARKITGRAVVARKISRDDETLVVLAAAYHDRVQREGSGVNEYKSSQLLHEMVVRVLHWGDRQDLMATFEEAIMATRVEYIGGIMRQAVDDDSSYTAKILADADLSILGEKPEIHFPAVRGLLRELHGENPSREETVKFLTNQMRLLETHEWFTEEAEQLFPHQRENAEITRRMLDLLH
jgi:predicted metal-dependent HD superfamily phosphohydrolase